MKCKEVGMLFRARKVADRAERSMFTARIKLKESYLPLKNKQTSKRA